MLRAYGPLSPTNCREGSSRAIETALPDIGIGIDGGSHHDRRHPSPGGGRLQLRRRGHRMCAGRGPRSGRGAEGLDCGRPLSLRERLVLRHRLGSRRRLGSGPSWTSRWHRTTLSNYPMIRQPLDEGAIMLPSARPARRAVMGAIGAGALAGAMFFGAAATAAAQPLPPPPPVPPPCTAAELARVMSGVTFDTSNYLATNPAVNDFFTSLKGQPNEEIRAQVQTYLDANPQVRDRASAYPATLGRLPPTLWGSGDPLTVAAARFVAQAVRSSAAVWMGLLVRQQVSSKCMLHNTSGAGDPPSPRDSPRGRSPGRSR